MKNPQKMIRAAMQQLVAAKWKALAGLSFNAYLERGERGAITLFLPTPLARFFADGVTEAEVHYLTYGEFTAAGRVPRPEIARQIERYDPSEEVVLVVVDAAQFVAAGVYRGHPPPYACDAEEIDADADFIRADDSVIFLPGDGATH